MKEILLIAIAILITGCAAPTVSVKDNRQVFVQKPLKGQIEENVYHEPQKYFDFLLTEKETMFEEVSEKFVAKLGAHDGKGDYREITIYPQEMLPYDAKTQQGLTEIRQFEISLLNPKFPGIRTLHEECVTLDDSKIVKFAIFKVPAGGTFYRPELKRCMDATRCLFIYGEKDKIVILCYQHTAIDENTDEFPKLTSEIIPLAYNQLFDLYKRVRIY